ncbi:MAG: hypothetical protein CMP08_06570 [Xanthomonadales bacterium]|nr:hypothetical protein [Xanthomonadales bacterium]
MTRTEGLSRDQAGVVWAGPNHALLVSRGEERGPRFRGLAWIAALMTDQSEPAITARGRVQCIVL